MNDVLLKPFLQLVRILDQRLSTPSQLHSTEALSLRAKEGVVIDLSESIRRLVVNLEKQDRLLSISGLAELRYAMAAWCDELLLSHWRLEADSTEVNPYVEQTMFGTMEAGEKIFWCIDRALDRRSEADLQMAPVYLTMLALGYRGQYSDAGVPERLREQLQTLSDVCAIETSAKLPLQQLASSEVALPAPQREPSLLPWALIISAVVCFGSLVYADWQWQQRFGTMGAQLYPHAVSSTNDSAGQP